MIWVRLCKEMIKNCGYFLLNSKLCKNWMKQKLSIFRQHFFSSFCKFYSEFHEFHEFLEFLATATAIFIEIGDFWIIFLYFLDLVYLLSFYCYFIEIYVQNGIEVIILVFPAFLVFVSFWLRGQINYFYCFE